MVKLRVTFQDNCHQDVTCEFVTVREGVTYFTNARLYDDMVVLASQLVYTHNTADIKSITKYNK